MNQWVCLPDHCSWMWSILIKKFFLQFYLKTKWFYAKNASAQSGARKLIIFGVNCIMTNNRPFGTFQNTWRNIPKHMKKIRSRSFLFHVLWSLPNRHVYIHVYIQVNLYICILVQTPETTPPPRSRREAGNAVRVSACEVVTYEAFASRQGPFRLVYMSVFFSFFLFF